jgi:hypothetical protein
VVDAPDVKTDPQFVGNQTPADNVKKQAIHLKEAIDNQLKSHEPVIVVPGR